eukprot:356177-Chlamydomonas_euryale.AAC.7
MCAAGSRQPRLSPFAIAPALSIYRVPAIMAAAAQFSVLGRVYKPCRSGGSCTNSTQPHPPRRKRSHNIPNRYPGHSSGLVAKLPKNSLALLRVFCMFQSGHADNQDTHQLESALQLIPFTPRLSWPNRQYTVMLVASAFLQGPPSHSSGHGHLTSKFRTWPAFQPYWHAEQSSSKLKPCATGW